MGVSRPAASALGADRTPILIEDGERYKNLNTVARIYDALVKAQADRSTVIVAVGGGVIGDMVGFAAATYLRGLRLVQVPTTLLAQVDSAIGGKTGVNHPLGKNLIGAFHAPQPGRRRSDGPGHAAAPRVPRRAVRSDQVRRDRRAVAARPHARRIAPRSSTASQRRSRRSSSASCRIKADVVSADERESGLRRILNFGHTVGHALEAVTKYSRSATARRSATGCWRRPRSASPAASRRNPPSTRSTTS